MTLADDFKTWELKWEPRHIKRFWDWWGSNPALEDHYFSKRNGESVIDHLRAFVGLSGTVIDLGAGPGFLVDLLLRRGVKTLAIDLSPESISRLSKKYVEHPKFLGARTSTLDSVPVTDGAGDIVLLIETIEHLDDFALSSILREARRILKVGGHIFITTPNEENLANLQVLCPNCGCVFHTYQHMRSWSAESLREKMHSYGFLTMTCQPTLFSFLPSPWRLFHRFAYYMMKKRLPHLLYIGRAI